MKNEKRITPEASVVKVEYTLWDKLTFPFVYALNWLKEKFTAIRHFFQRGKRCYSDYDIWDIHSWLVHSLRPMLEDIIEHLYTHPAEITEEEWRAILEEMVHLLNIMDIDDNTTAREVLGVAADDHSKETYKKIADEQERARARFFELFYKWYWDLRY